MDFTSLYPDILKYKIFPLGHPKRIVDKLNGITTEKCTGNCIYAKCDGEHLKMPYFGIIKATFIPPKDLLYPVLPIRCNGKLKFPFCYKCAREENTEECNCHLEDRSFTHTYCPPEINVALNVGYIIKELHEMLHWSDTEMYDPITKQGGLFTEYINTFLKLNRRLVVTLETLKMKKKKMNTYKDITNMKEF